PVPLALNAITVSSHRLSWIPGHGRAAICPYAELLREYPAEVARSVGKILPRVHGGYAMHSERPHTAGLIGFWWVERVAEPPAAPNRVAFWVRGGVSGGGSPAGRSSPNGC